MYCTAHQHGVRVLEWSMLGDPTTDNATSHCPVTELYEWARSKNSTLHAKMYDPAEVAAWASASAVCVASHGLDGILLDMEGGGDSQVPHNQTQRDAITAAVCALKQQLSAQIPGSVLYWTTDTGDYFDYGEMIKKECVDMFADMAYCLCAADGHNRANTPLPVISHIVDTYQEYGVPPEKLAILAGWFGCDFECLGGDHGSQACDKVQLVGEPGFGQTLDLLANKTGEVTLNTSLQTKMFVWTNASGFTHQLWYDDAETLKVKYDAIKSAGVRGLGMWTADAVQNCPTYPHDRYSPAAWGRAECSVDSTQIEAMWGALPVDVGR